MVLNNLPEDTLKNVTSYLLPSDVFNLCMSYPTDEKRYKPLLIGSLGNSLRRVMGSGSVKFRSSDPLQSFCDMTEFSPRGSIVLSGSLIVQTILGKSGKSWPNTDIDIFVHETEAPIVRKWLLDEFQVFAGCSAAYSHGEFDRNISHVEYYINRDDGKYSYADASERGERIRKHMIAAGRWIELLVNGGETMPFKPYQDFGGHKKEIVNIDLIVVRTGRSVHHTLDSFDLNICRSCFDGKEWAIPQPLQTFGGATELTSIADNMIAKAYIAGIIRESQRDLESVVEEMKLHHHHHRYGVKNPGELKDLVQKLGGDVFSPGIIHPIVSTMQSYSPSVYFVGLVIDIRNHLILNAVRKVREIGMCRSSQTHQLREVVNNWVSSPSPRLLHNRVIKLWVRRFHKYMKRGVRIHGLPDVGTWRESSSVLRCLPRFNDIVRGVTWPRDDPIFVDGENNAVPPSVWLA